MNKSKPIISDPYQEIIAHLYQAFHHFNEVLCNNTLKPAVITASSKGKKAAYGWHAALRWAKGKEDLTEINISAEYLNRTWSDLCETLIHEMVHLGNSQAGITDCNAAQYHNRKFKTRAEEYGLVVSKMAGKGWASTKLGPKAEAAIKLLGIRNEDVPKIYRKEKRSKKTPLTSVLCTWDDKEKFNQMAMNGGMKQPEFMSLLLNTFMEHEDNNTEEAAATMIAGN